MSQHVLSGDPVWTAVMEYAEMEVATGKAEADIRAIAERGAEYRAASQLLENGSALENIAFAPMVFKWPEDGPPDLLPKGTRKPKWWPFGTAS